MATFDEDGDGVISQAEFTRGMHSLTVPQPEEEEEEEEELCDLPSLDDARFLVLRRA